MRRILLMFTVVALLMLRSAVPTFAQVAPGGGNEFGKHVSGMALEGHPKPIELGGHGGQHFGGCVSEPATTGECSMMV